MRARTTHVPASPTAVPRSRHFVTDVLGSWQIDSTTVDDIELVVSELVTNAFLHGVAPSVQISVADTGSAVRLEVTHREAAADPRPAEPLAPLTVAPGSVHGRGLAIVDVLARNWGVVERDGERRVWAELVHERAGLVPETDRAAVLAELTGALERAARHGDTRAVGDAVAGWARRCLGTTFVGVAVPDDEPGMLRYLSVEPLPPATVSAWRRFPVGAPAPVAACFRAGRASFHETRSAAVATFPGLGPTLSTAEVTAIANLPLPGLPPTRSLLGVLTLSWTHGQLLDEREQTWLAEVARHTAAALAAAS